MSTLFRRSITMIDTRPTPIARARQSRNIDTIVGRIAILIAVFVAGMAAGGWL